MNTKIEVVRALSSVVAKHTLRIALFIALIVAVLLFAGIWALAYYVSAWWWLLLLLYLPCVVVVAIIYLILRVIVTRVYPTRLTRTQKEALHAFAGKIQRLLEAVVWDGGRLSYCA